MIYDQKWNNGDVYDFRCATFNWLLMSEMCFWYDIYVNVIEVSNYRYYVLLCNVPYIVWLHVLQVTIRYSVLLYNISYIVRLYALRYLASKYSLLRIIV